MAEHTLEVVDVPQGGMVPRCHPSHSSHQGRRYQEIYLCGKCGIIVARDVPADVLEQSAIRCPNCGACNRAPTLAERVTGVIYGKTGRLHKLKT